MTKRRLQLAPILAKEAASASGADRASSAVRTEASSTVLLERLPERLLCRLPSLGGTGSVRRHHRPRYDQGRSPPQRARSLQRQMSPRTLWCPRTSGRSSARAGSHTPKMPGPEDDLSDPMTLTANFRVGRYFQCLMAMRLPEVADPDLQAGRREYCRVLCFRVVRSNRSKSELAAPVDIQSDQILAQPSYMFGPAIGHHPRYGDKFSTEQDPFIFGLIGQAIITADLRLKSFLGSKSRHRQVKQN